METKIEISTSMKNGIVVAFATSDLENIDAHFGSTKQFAIYRVDKNGYETIKIIKTNKDELGEGNKTDKIIEALSGVDIVYFLDIGATAAAKVINKKIFPIKYKEIIKIDDELEKLSKMLSSNPPPFIKKIIEKKI